MAEILERLTNQGDGTSAHKRFTSKPLVMQTGESVGTVGSNVTAVEYGNKFYHVTELTLTDVVNQAIAGGAALGVGNLIYTLPAGACQITAARMSVAFTALDGNIDADTPDVGIGTVIASGVVSVLSGTATFENIITGQTAADCAGTATVFAGGPTAGAVLEILTGAAHTVYLNWADTWAASGEAAGATISGTVRLYWNYLGA